MTYINIVIVYRFFGKKGDNSFGKITTEVRNSMEEKKCIGQESFNDTGKYFICPKHT